MYYQDSLAYAYGLKHRCGRYPLAPVLGFGQAMCSLGFVHWAVLSGEGYTLGAVGYEPAFLCAYEEASEEAWSRTREMGGELNAPLLFDGLLAEALSVRGYPQGCVP